MNLLRVVSGAFGCISVACFAITSQAATLWSIGTSDNSGTDLALAPRDFAQIKSDGFFVPGESNPREDWPYSHPGPLDKWAGERSHTFAVQFGLKATPGAGECALHIDLLDTHEAAPPRLAIDINGRRFEESLPRGGGDGSINGNPEKAREHRLKLAFPAELLRQGDNELRITTLSGSWMIYDALWLETPAGAILGQVSSRTMVESVDGVRAIKESQGRLWQPVSVTVRHFGAPAEGKLRVAGAADLPIQVTRDRQSFETFVPWAPTNRQVAVEVELEGKVAARHEVTLKPARKLTVYILPHSHTDIGYTEIQTDIEKRQVQNLVDGMAAAKRTADYPEGSRFIWNVEVLWAADLFLKRLGSEQRQEFMEAVRSGRVALNGMYLNELTALCRPEELVRLFKYSTELAEQTGVPIESLMISDVPGYTWGTVTAMAQAGIKYFSTAPNYFDRIGTILREWENKPFYWVGPDGRQKVLVWIPFWGYAMSHRYGKLSPKLVEDFCDGLDQKGYPYDIAHVRWSGHGDNAVPDPAICEFVRDWNAKYSYPKFIISSTTEAFKAFEARYGSQLPHATGDWTPYWEDGAGSSALETGMNRHSSDRLAQAETLVALFDHKAYRPEAFSEAWNNVLLYSEHTWGAHCSVNGPERKETIEQWDIKRSYAEMAAQQSRELLAKAFSYRPGREQVGSVDVLNTATWERSGLAMLPARVAPGANSVLSRGKPIYTQRLNSGELAFMATDVPPLGFARFELSSKVVPFKSEPARAQGTTLENGLLRLVVDPATGSIIELRARNISENLVDTSGAEGLNEYLYFTGADPATAAKSKVTSITVVDQGPLVASLKIEATAPGCRSLVRTLTLAAGSDFVEVETLVDKERLQSASYMAPEGKESLSLGFPFNVRDGEMILDVPLGHFRPEREQLASACKNWLTVGRWAQVANKKYGVTWVTLDAPLLQLGGLTANLLNSQYDPAVWRKNIEPTQKIYSWAMNNHWGTNYRAYQEGLTRFGFVIRVSRNATPADAARFATGFSQPLITTPARGPLTQPPGFELSSDEIFATGLKPSDDGRAWIVRLHNPGTRSASTSLQWRNPSRPAVYFSNTSEKVLQKAPGKINIPARGLVTLRAELE